MITVKGTYILLYQGNIFVCLQTHIEEKCKFIKMSYISTNVYKYT